MTILIVDDNEANLYQLQVLLGGNGYQVATAANGTEALTKARQNPPDLIISDILMPVMDGFALCREWKTDERLRQIPFVFYTATYTDERDREFALSLGAEQFLVKPEEPEVFIRKIREVIQQVHRPPAPPARAAAEPPQKDEAVYLKQYNEALVRKLESKMQQLEQANRELERDITERKRAEESLRRLAAAVEQAAETIVITDGDGTILYANPAFEKTSGYTRQEAIGQNPRILKSGKQDAEFYRRMWAALTAGEVWHGHIINKRKDGNLYAEDATISPVRDAAGKIVNYVAVKRDVTRETQLEDQLRQAQKMEAIGRLAGGVAHDFNNLLTAIIGYSDMALKDLTADNPLRAHIEEVRAAGERASALTRQLLAFSRKQVLQPQVLNLNDLTANLNKMLCRLIGEDVLLTTIFDPAVGHVKADPCQIEQVIINLAVNARDAMPEGGTLTIQTANTELDEAYASQHEDVTPGRYVQLAISDTGKGMTNEVKAHLFEPFFTTKGQGKGTGLGLATVFGIVKQSGGHITVYSEAGHGTMFKIYLPRVEGTAEVAVAAKVRAKAPRGTETILLVEDEEQIRKLARVALEECGYTVLSAGNGSEALSLAEQHAGTLDLLLTDMIMPGINGHMLAKTLRPRNPKMATIFMSGYTDTNIVPQETRAEGAAFLQKPFMLDVLARKVREVLDASPKNPPTT